MLTTFGQDQTWSSQDERQIDGRVWRQPQDKNVIIYHVLADQTSDIMLSGMASTKRDMLDAFLDKNTGEGNQFNNFHFVSLLISRSVDLLQLLSGKTIQGDDSGDEEDRHGDLSVSKRKSTSSLNSIQSNDNHGVEEMPRKVKGEKKRKSKRERKVSKSPLAVEPTPELEEPVPVGDTASEGGGTSDFTSDSRTSEGEDSSSMSSQMEDLDIYEDPQGE
jgi:hypothetical protein